jgi:hypothetical protein
MFKLRSSPYLKVSFAGCGLAVAWGIFTAPQTVVAEMAVHDEPIEVASADEIAAGGLEGDEPLWMIVDAARRALRAPKPREVLYQAKPADGYSIESKLQERPLAALPATPSPLARDPM